MGAERKRRAQKRTEEERQHCCPLCQMWEHIGETGERYRETREHFRSASLEMVKGFRSMVDSWITEMEKRGGKKRDFTKISVE